MLVTFTASKHDFLLLKDCWFIPAVHHKFRFHSIHILWSEGFEIHQKSRIFNETLSLSMKKEFKAHKRKDMYKIMWLLWRKNNNAYFRFDCQCLHILWNNCLGFCPFSVFVFAWEDAETFETLYIWILSQIIILYSSKSSNYEHMLDFISIVSNYLDIKASNDAISAQVTSCTSTLIREMDVVDKRQKI